MPTVLDFNPTVDPSELVRTIREALAVGSAVVLPGDCGYVVLVNPAAASAVELLAVLASPPAVLAWGPDDPLGLGLPLSKAARRLLARGWPAPMVVAIPGKAEWPVHWSSAVRTKLSANPARFRCPEHPLFETIAPALELPVLVVDTFFPTAEAVLDLLEDSTAVAVSTGAQPVAGKPTVVVMNENQFEVAEAGLLPTDELEKLAARIVLFVCTGNTCRSPLAEALAKKLLCDRFRCTVEDLPRRGVWVVSAGVSAYGESPATPEAVAVAAEFGADLSDHLGQSVNPQLLAAADDVIAMTRSHAQTLVTRYHGVGPVPRLLCGNSDLDDPIGAGIDVYRRCAQTILTNLERITSEWTGK